MPIPHTNPMPLQESSPTPRPSPVETWSAACPNELGRSLIALSRRTFLGRGAGRKVLTALLRRLHSGPVDTHLWGAPVRLHPWNNVSERKALMRPDRLDAIEHGLLARTMAARPSVFVDIGANAGLYSLRAALSSVAGGKILAIEPNGELLGRLLFNLAAAEAAGRIARGVDVITVAAALSDYNGTGTLSRGGGEGTRRLEPSADGDVVPVRRLDSLLAEYGIDCVDILKIDVEGAEDRILPSFYATAKDVHWPRQVIIEHLSRSSWSVDCISDCCARGYQVVATTRNNTVLERNLG